jgi:DNA modification methylase
MGQGKRQTPPAEGSGITAESSGFSEETIYGFEPNVNDERGTREFLPREYWKPSQLKPAAYNVTRKMSDEQFQELKRGIEHFGLLGGLDVRAEDGLMIGGHQRRRACLELIEENRDNAEKLASMNLPEGKIPVSPIKGLTDAEAALLNIRLNNKEAQGEWDMPNLAEFLSELDGLGFDATLSGFRGDKLEEILTFEEEPSETREEKEDVDLSLPKEPRTKKGDLYQLGRHYLLCGDARTPAAWDRLLRGATLDGIATDPPYGVDYVGKTADALKIQNDAVDEEALLSDIRKSITLAHGNLKPGGAIYIFAPGGPLFWVFATVMRELHAWRQTISWVKDRFVLGRQDYQWREEPALYGEKDDPDEERGPVPEKVKREAAKRKQPILYGWREGGRHYFVDDRTQDTFWTVERPARSAEHPTMKPVELIRRMYRNSSKPAAKWADPFVGSGTSLIAGEQTARTVYAMEIDPKYCDVAIHRWEEFSGKEAVKVAGG